MIVKQATVKNLLRKWGFKNQKEAQIVKYGNFRCEKCGYDGPLLNKPNRCYCPPKKDELRPSLRWSDALLFIQEQNDEIERLRKEISRLEAEVREWMDDRDNWLARFDKANRELEVEKEKVKRLREALEKIREGIPSQNKIISESDYWKLASEALKETEEK